MNKFCLYILRFLNLQILYRAKRKSQTFVHIFLRGTESLFFAFTDEGGTCLSYSNNLKICYSRLAYGKHLASTLFKW